MLCVSGGDPGLELTDCPRAGGRVPVLQTYSAEQLEWVKDNSVAICAQIKVPRFRCWW